MSTLSTHVLDAARGMPAEGLGVRVSNAEETLAIAATDADGRARFDVELEAGVYTLGFETGAWFAAQGRDTFFPTVGLVFGVDASEEHYHVALLLSPYSYTTYRGS